MNFANNMNGAAFKGKHMAFANPFVAWTQFAMRSSEMMMTSARAMTHRTTDLVNASADAAVEEGEQVVESAFAATRFPTLPLVDRRKIEDATESAAALTTQMLTASTNLATRALRQMVTGTTVLLALAQSRTVAETITQHANLVKAWSESAATASELTHAATRLADGGLQPMHTATANAERLLAA